MSRVCKLYKFDGAEQEVINYYKRPIIISGKHTFLKTKDNFTDILHGRSWYLMDDKELVYVLRGGYVETRCLQEVKE